LELLELWQQRAMYFDDRPEDAQLVVPELWRMDVERPFDLCNCRMLRRGTRFEGAVEAILLRGGDTDTNAGAPAFSHNALLGRLRSLRFCRTLPATLALSFVFNSRDEPAAVGFVDVPPSRSRCMPAVNVDPCAAKLPYSTATVSAAAIVGGLLGALWGASNIPAAWREAVLGRTAASAGIPRPEWLLPG